MVFLDCLLQYWYTIFENQLVCISHPVEYHGLVNPLKEYHGLANPLEEYHGLKNPLEDHSLEYYQNTLHSQVEEERDNSTNYKTLRTIPSYNHIEEWKDDPEGDRMDNSSHCLHVNFPTAVPSIYCKRF